LEREDGSSIVDYGFFDIKAIWDVYVPDGFFCWKEDEMERLMDIKEDCKLLNVV